MDRPIEKSKPVFVHAYVRQRLQRIESVCAHWRSRPVQLQLNFG